MSQHDPVEDILLPLNISTRLKATTWDAVNQATDEADLEQRLRKLPLPDDTRAALFDARFNPQPAPAQAPTGGKPWGIRPTTWRDTVATGLRSLETVGGLAGGLLGGVAGGVPGALAGAGLGGGAGEAINQLGRRAIGYSAPWSPIGAATDIASAGGRQAAAEAGGRALGAGAKVMGKSMIENAVRPPIGLQEEFPNVIDTIIKERLPVGRALPGTQSGSQQAKALLRESAGKTRGILKEAEQKGVDFATQDIAKPVADLADDIAKQPLADNELSGVSRMFMQFMREKGERLTPTQVKDLKQSAQAIAKPIFRAARKGGAVTADQSLNARFNEAIARGSKEALETIPEVGASEARTKDLIGATRAISQAERRRLPLSVELASMGTAGALGAATGSDYQSGAARGAGSAFLVRALMSPRSASRMGLALTRPQVEHILRQMPRASVYALLEQLQQEGGEQADQGDKAGKPE